MLFFYAKEIKPIARTQRRISEKSETIDAVQEAASSPVFLKLKRL
jgi:hypothetical protein